MKCTNSLAILPILTYLTHGSKATDIFIDEDPKEISYFEIATKSKYFVDKTTLLKIFVEKKYIWDDKSRTIVFTCPKGFGKTTNLDMIRRFFQVPFDKITGEKIHKKTSHYYKLFTNISLNFEIAREQNFIDEHFGEYPIIYLDFSNIEGRTSDEIITSIRKRIGTVLNSYRWLCIKTRRENKNPIDKSLKQHLNNFRKIFKKNATAIDYVYALESLAELMAQHFDKKQIMVLMDNYDIPFMRAVTSDTVAQPVYDFMHFLLKIFVKFQLLPCYVMVIGTSFYPFTKWDSSSDISWIKTLESNFFLRCPAELGKYFGFTVNELDRLLTVHKISHERENLIKYFGNYQFTKSKYNRLNLSLLHPTGVLRYLETNIIEYHHLDDHVLTPIMKCSQYEDFFKQIEKLLRNQVIPSIANSLPLYEFYLLFSKFVNLAEYNCSHLPNEIVYETVLLDNGYISLRNHQSTIQIPNKMAQHQLKQSLNRFFYDSYRINITNTAVTASIHAILNSRITTDEMLSNLADSLQRMINSGISSNLNQIQVLYIVLTTLLNHCDFDQYSKMETEKPYFLYEKFTYMIQFQNRLEKMAIIVQVFFNASLQKAISFACNWVPQRWPYNQDFNLVKCIGINIKGQNQIEIGKGHNRDRP